MSQTKQARLIVDMSNGDAGKGTLVDYWAREEPVNVVFRTSGGPQCAHNVITPDGRHHTFSQIGAATFVPGVQTHYARFCQFNPLALIAEAKHLRTVGITDALERFSVHRDAPVITPFQQAANRLRELARGHSRHGSCGAGIGETALDAQELGAATFRTGDLRGDWQTAWRKLEVLRERKLSQCREAIIRCRELRVGVSDIELLESLDVSANFLDMARSAMRTVAIVDDAFVGRLLAQPGRILFEGSQGVLLDEWHGFFPHVTRSTCTFDNALALLGEHGYDGNIIRCGVVRAYASRHGAGPFMTEDSRLGALIPDMHNAAHEWQQAFRIGWFDAVATRYAITVCGGIDELAVTGMDRLRDIPHWRVATGYQLPDTDQLPRFFQMTGRTARDIVLPPWHDLEYLRELTAILGQVEPIWKFTGLGGTFEERVADHLDVMSNELMQRIDLVSYGPTATDKKRCR